MCSAEVMNVVTGVSALSASLIALFTLCEIKRQRKEANKPDIAVRQKLVYVHGVRYNDFTLPFLFSESGEPVAKPNDAVSNCSLDIVNFGIRSAKDIKLRWEFDFKGAINSIKEQDDEKIFNLELIGNILKVSMQLSGYKVSNLYMNQLRGVDVDFILNSTPDSFDTIYLQFPIIVLELYVISLCLSLGFYKSENVESPEKGELGQFRKPLLIMEYKDIGGVRYAKTFSFDIDMVLFDDPMKVMANQRVGELVITSKEMKSGFPSPLKFLSGRL